MLRKAQRREKEEWRRIRDDIARETTDNIERKLRTAIEHLLGGTGRQLKPSERARIEEIAGQPAAEVVQHVFMYLSHRDMFPSEINDALRRFFNYVTANQFASTLFKLAICKGTIEDSDQVEDQQVDENDEQTDEEEGGDESGNEAYDVEWDRKHHRQVVAESKREERPVRWCPSVYTSACQLRIIACLHTCNKRCAVSSLFCFSIGQSMS